MLRELENVRQIPGEPMRRWFSNDTFDLVVFIDESNTPSGFQLIYDKVGLGRALSWDKETGYSHHQIDDGEGRPGMPKATPILIADGVFNQSALMNAFQDASSGMDREISGWVLLKIREYS